MLVLWYGGCRSHQGWLVLAGAGREMAQSFLTPAASFPAHCPQAWSPHCPCLESRGSRLDSGRQTRSGFLPWPRPRTWASPMGNSGRAPWLDRNPAPGASIPSAPDPRPRDHAPAVKRLLGVAAAGRGSPPPQRPVLAGSPRGRQRPGPAWGPGGPFLRAAPRRGVWWALSGRRAGTQWVLGEHWPPRSGSRARASGPAAGAGQGRGAGARGGGPWVLAPMLPRRLTASRSPSP